MLVDLLVLNRKEGSFNMSQQIIPENELLQKEWRQDIYAVAENIILNTQKDYWPKSTPGPCSAFHTPCSYLDLCTSSKETIQDVKRNSYKEVTD